MLRFLIVATLPFIGAASAQAHPHIFIDAGLALHFDDDGRLAQVEVTWVYDDFYSMLVIDDLGLDQDYTGEIDDGERAELSGFDMNWVEGYAGDLFGFAGETPLELSGPQDWTADFTDGRITTTHRREIENGVDPAAGEIAFEVYDPTYYTEYRVAFDPVISGRDDCVARVDVPDRDAAEAMLQDKLDDMIADGADTADIEAEFPEVGDAFAEEVRIACNASS